MSAVRNVLLSERVLHVLGAGMIAVGAAYLVWLFAFALDWSIWWMAVPLAAAHVQAYVAGLFFLFNVWHHELVTPQPPIEGRSVDILIPTLNESFAVLAPTVIAAGGIDYPHKTYVLDDGRRDWVRDLCAEVGATWVTRPDRSAAKAGNLNHGLGVSEGEFVVTLDADFIASPRLVHDLIGYFADPLVALVQGPQVYYNTNSFQHARETSLWNEQSIFYQVVQPGKNHWNAAFWCGAPAMLRRTALEAVGGVSTDSATEDIATSVELHRRGWKSVYHHGLVAAGLAPEDFDRFYRQRLRWVRGGIHVFRQQLIRRSSGLEGMRLTQRLSYLASTGRPWDVMRQMVFYAFTPLVAFTGIFPIHGSEWNISAFVAAQAAIIIGTVGFSRGTYRIVHAEIYDILSMAAGIVALSSFWESKPRGFAVTAKGNAGLRQHPARGPLVWIIAVALLYVAAVPSGFIRAADEGFPNPLFFFTLWTVAYAGLLVLCVVFAVRHGNQAWAGMSIQPLPAKLSAEGTAFEATLQRLAVDQLELYVEGRPVLQRDSAVSVGLPLIGKTLEARVAGVRRSGEGFAVSIVLLESSLELAEFIAEGMFEPATAHHSRFSVLHYGYARAASSNAPSLPL